MRTETCGVLTAAEKHFDDSSNLMSYYFGDLNKNRRNKKQQGGVRRGKKQASATSETCFTMPFNHVTVGLI